MAEIFQGIFNPNVYICIYITSLLHLKYFNILITQDTDHCRLVVTFGGNVE